MEIQIEFDHNDPNLSGALGIIKKDFQISNIINNLKYRKQCNNENVQPNILFEILTLTGKAETLQETIYMLTHLNDYIEAREVYGEQKARNPVSDALYHALKVNYDINSFIATSISDKTYAEYSKHESFGNKNSVQVQDSEVLKDLVNIFGLSKEKSKKIILFLESMRRSKKKEYDSRSKEIEAVIEFVDNYPELYFAFAVLGRFIDKQKR